MGYFDLGYVEKSRSPAGMVNGIYENMYKKPINMDKKSSKIIKYGHKYIHKIKYCDFN